MGLPQLRSEVESLIRRADERLLKMVYALVVTYSNEEIVAYAADGTPLTPKAYNDELKAGEEDIKAGRTVSTEVLKKRTEAWKGKYSK